MKKLNLLLVFVLAFALLAVSFTAYGVDVPSQAETEEKMKEIYSSTDMAVSGIFPPEWQDRSDLNKALPDETKEHITIGVTMSRMASPFFVAMVDAFKAEAEKYGHELIIMNADVKLEKQTSDIESLITNEVDALILNPIEPVASAVDVQKCIRAGIPVIGVGLNFAPEVPVVTSILANNYFAGWEAGLHIGEYFEGKPIKAAVIIGGMGQPMSESRLNGMLGGFIYKRQEQMGEPVTQEQAIVMGFEIWKTIRNRGKAKSENHDLNIVAFSSDGRWTNEGGLAAMQDILTAHSDINLLMAENDIMGEGAMTAIKQAGLTPGIDVENGEIAISCAADGQRVMLDYVKEGKLLNTGYNSPHLTAASCVRLFHKIFVEGYDASNMPYVANLPSFAITKENVDKFYDPDLNFAAPVEFEFKTVPELNAGAK